MSQRSSGRLAAIVARDEFLAAGGKFVEPVPVPQRFTLEDWQTERDFRELLDTIAHGLQWKISVALGDGTLRQFFLTGTHAEVQRRAQNFFRHPAIISFELSGFVGGEVIDRRLNSITTGS